MERMKRKAKSRKNMSFARKCDTSGAKSVEVSWKLNRQSANVPNVDGYSFTRKKPKNAKNLTQYYKCSSNGCNVRLITRGVDLPGYAGEGENKTRKSNKLFVPQTIMTYLFQAFLLEAINTRALFSQNRQGYLTDREQLRIQSRNKTW